MSLKSRQEYIAEARKEYRSADRKRKGEILDSVCRLGNYNRKYAVTLLNGAPKSPKADAKRKRGKVYGTEVQSALANLWVMSGGLCSKRLVPFLPDFLGILEHHNEINFSESLKSKLLSISIATADRLLREARRSRPHGICTTKPGTLLRQQIEVRTTYKWDEQVPGYFEVDLVAHCDTNASGEFLYTLTMTDIATGWTECRPLLNRSCIGVTKEIDHVRTRLPFPIKGIDSDNGSEFINHHLFRYCKDNEIAFTRSRPYKKNDQCHVEQKNWSVVRRNIGYARYEGELECKYLRRAHMALNKHVNYFQPSMKLIEKERTEAKIRKTYDKAKTPLQRLIAFGQIDSEVAAGLLNQWKSINPIQLQDKFSDAMIDLETVRSERVCAAAAASEIAPTDTSALLDQSGGSAKQDGRVPPASQAQTAKTGLDKPTVRGSSHKSPRPPLVQKAQLERQPNDWSKTTPTMPDK